MSAFFRINPKTCNEITKRKHPKTRFIATAFNVSRTLGPE